MKKILKRFGYTLLGVSVMCLAAISCSSPTGSDSPPDNPQNPSSDSGSEPGVYIAGCYEEGSLFPCYWRDGEIVELSTHGTNGGYVGACFNDNGTMRFAGNQYKTVSIWSDRYRTDWRNGYSDSPMIKAMYVRGSQTCIVGYVGSSAVYWKNDVLTTLISGSSGSVLEGVYIDEALNTHICGTKEYYTPMYWKNDTPYLLQTVGGSGQAYDITMADGHVYIAGSGSNGIDRIIACYWVDGVRHDLNTAASNMSVAYSIYIDGADIYVGGYYCANGDYNTGKNHACYWKNGELTDLSGRGAQVDDIVVSSGKVYACGNTRSQILIDEWVGCYWIDGVLHELTSLCNKGSGASSIVVK